MNAIISTAKSTATASSVNASAATPKKTPPRLIEVVHIENPHPEIKRVIFSGNALKGFPPDMNGSHIKLFFPKPHQKEPRLPTLGPNGPVWPSALERPITRTYTVRNYDPLRNEIAIDFAWHSCEETGHHFDSLGPAGRWLLQAKKGQRIGLAGPGGPDPLIHPAKHQLFVGDTSTLGALWALTETPTISEQMIYLVANHPATFESANNAVKCFAPSQYPTLAALYEDLLNELQADLETKNISAESDFSAFIAGENELVLRIRNHLKQQYGLTKKRMYAIPYWRYGQDEEAYHQTRHDIMDEVY